MNEFLSRVRDALAAHGFTSAQVEAKAALFGRCAEALGRTDGHAYFVPGRVEVLGKHTDYCGGRSVVMAVDQGIAVLATPRSDDLVRIVNPDYGTSVEFAIREDLERTVGHWSNYPMTTARRLARDFPGPLRGADIAISSDLVPASGMSSSSALIIASFFALAAANELESHPLYRSELRDLSELANYVAAIEGGKGYGAFRADHGVGTAGGSEDHTAILCSEAGRLGVYSYRPVRPETTVAFPSDYGVFVCSSGVVAEKTGAAMELYNRASRLASAGAAVAAGVLGVEAEDFATLVRLSGVGAVAKALASASGGEFDAEELAVRFEAFVTESESIIPKAVRALEAGDLEEWGRQVDLSQVKGAELLGNQVPETVFLAESARRLGARAASAFGAGFGGSVWAMARIDQASEFIEAWQAAYLAGFPQYRESARFFMTRPGPAAFGV